MKTFKKIVSLSLMVLMVASMFVSTTVFAATSTAVAIEPYCNENFESYSYYRINTGGTVTFDGGNEDGIAALSQTGVFLNGTVTSGGNDWAGNYTRNFSIEKYVDGDKTNNTFRATLDTQIAFSRANFESYLTNAITNGADSFAIKFDIMIENPNATSFTDIRYSIQDWERHSLILSGGNAYYGQMSGWQAPEINDTNKVAGVNVSANNWYPVEYRYESGKLTMKFDGVEVFSKASANMTDILWNDTQMFFIASYTDNAVNIDNVEIGAYKWVPSPNSVWLNETFETYQANPNQDGDNGVMALAANGVINAAYGGSLDHNGYARYTSIMIDSNSNKYFRATVGTHLGGETTPFTKFSEYISECGAESFIIDFDFMLDMLPATALEMRYRPANISDGGPYFMFFFKDDKVYARVGHNTFSDEMVPVEGITIAANEWNKISYAYNDGTLRAFFNDKLVAEKSGFASANDAAYDWMYLGALANTAAMCMDNLKFQCYSDGVDTLDATFSESVSNGGNATVTATYESRLLHGLQTYVAVYNKDTKQMVDVVKGVSATPASIGAGSQTATLTVPETGNYTVKAFVWGDNFKPFTDFVPLSVN